MKEISLKRDNEESKEILMELDTIKNKKKYGFLLAIINILLGFVIALFILFLRGKFIVMLSPSMEPEIGVYDVVYSTKDNFDKVKIGDIISYYSNGEAIISRVVQRFNGKEGIFLRTRGDNNSNLDSEYVTSDNYIGMVKVVLPKWVSKFNLKNSVENSKYINVYLGIITLMIIILDIVVIYKKSKLN